MRSPFKISITVFLGLASSLLMLVFLVISIGALNSIGEIARLSSAVRQKNLPEILENQRSFINLESLRRIAEVAYVADDPQVRRSARIDAQALAAESVFNRDSGFHERARNLSTLITELVARRDAAYKNGLRLRELAQEFAQNMGQMGLYAPDAKMFQGIFQAYADTSMPSAGPIDSSARSPVLFEEQQKKDKDNIALIRRYCETYARQHPALAPACARLEETAAAYFQERELLLENDSSAREQWRVVDDALREMRDNLSSDSEFVTTDALTSIEERSAAADKAAWVVFAGGLLCFGLYLFILNWHIVRPVRWTAQKLKEIKQGSLHGTMPVIRISEMYNVGLLLDQFSEHLVELYSHASQLEEDVAGKQDLENLMRTVFQASLDGYAVWSMEGVMVANPGLLRLVGLNDPGELNAQRENMGFSSWDELGDIYARVTAGGTYRKELLLRTASGERMPCEVTYLPINYRGMSCVLSYFRDIRMQKRTEEELRFAKDAAEQAAKVKSDFLARMSHEIRTPMNGVLGLTHLALENSPPPRQKMYLEKIQASARILLGVINDILDFSKMESGKFHLERARFSFSGMLSTVVDLFQGQAEAKNLRFVLDKDEGISSFVIGDELRLSQVLLNLCSNAIKFTEQGEVILRIHIADQSADTVRLSFSVTDSGVGMTEDQLAGLFQPFTQADTSTTRKYGGTGLGLVISKLLVEMMDGEISVNSAPGAGSTFQFTIPLEKADASETAGEVAQSPETAEGESRDLRGLRVLLVEDNEINQEIAVALMESLGLSVLVAGNGAEALSLLADHDVDGVLMDIQMPVMDGLTAARLIRETGREGIRNLPIIAMTAHAMQEDRGKSLAAGMNDHITKPIDVRELRARLDRWVFPSSGRGK